LAELSDDSELIPNWCQGVIAPAHVERLVDLRRRAPELLLIARGGLAHGADITAARRMCEQLQRELPRELELGGYLVSAGDFATNRT
jgi:hypothetical protein